MIHSELQLAVVGFFSAAFGTNGPTNVLMPPLTAPPGLLAVGLSIHGFTAITASVASPGALQISAAIDVSVGVAAVYCC